MRATIEDFKTGWFGIGLGIKKSELDLLIQRLETLKNNPDLHFHLGSTYSGSGGVGDIEVYVEPEGSEDNLTMTGFPISPDPK